MKEKGGDLISELCFCFSAVLRKTGGEMSRESLGGKKKKQEKNLFFSVEAPKDSLTFWQKFFF